MTSDRCEPETDPIRERIREIAERAARNAAQAEQPASPPPKHWSETEEQAEDHDSEDEP